MASSGWSVRKFLLRGGRARVNVHTPVQIGKVVMNTKTNKEQLGCVFDAAVGDNRPPASVPGCRLSPRAAWGGTRFVASAMGGTRFVASALFAALLSAPSWAADRTISANYALSADETVDGVLTVASGVTVDLNGHNLTVKGLAGDGTITAGAQDLTSPDPNGERVWTSTEIQAGAAVNLFNNSYVYGNNNDTRVLVKKTKLPLVVTYDFGDGTPKKVDMYKVYFGPNSYNDRAPKAWTFAGSNDANAPTDPNATWVPLDTRTSETGWPKSVQQTRTYTFENDTAYRYYRISFTASSDTSTANAGPYLEFVQLEYFDSSAVPEIPPELRIDVPAGAFVTNSTVSIGGNIRLVKQGEGVFVAAKANQTYSGGNHVVAGTIKPYSSVDNLFGENGSDITVDSDATFDINGNLRCSLYHYVMNGGTVVNTGSAIGMNYAQLGDMTLLANTTIDRIGFVKANIAPLTIDLGGYVLEETISVATYFRNANITNGTLRLLRGSGNNALYFYASRAPTATLELGTHTGAYDDLSVSNLLLRAEFTTHSSATANAVYKVYGTFKTATTCFPFVRMMDGSTFDLKSWNGTFNFISTSDNPNGFKLMFDSGATVTIDIAGRTPTVGECLISWDEMPTGVTFQFDAATAAGGVPPVATERGLFYGYVDNVAEWAWWTGAASDGVLSNPQNWLCKNAGGGVIENGLPSDSTRVYLPSSLDVQIPENAALSCGVCILSNATLTTDCDLRGLGTKLEVAPNAVIDLNGHKLYARAAAFTGVCTVKGADTGHADDLTTTDTSRVSSSAFNGGNTPASNLFNNNYARGDNTKRVLVPKADWPLVVTYDFGEGKVVDAYRMWVGPLAEIQRMPKRWRFEGANDVDGSWTLLDSRNVEAEWPVRAVANRTYIFPNQTAYRYYRITVEDNCGGADQYGTYLELVQLEYFHLKPTQSELHLCTVSGESTELNNMSLTGNVRFFIEGAGLVWVGTEGQTYIGGTEICGGSVSGGGVGMTSLLNKDIFGGKGSEVVIRGDGSGNASATSGLIGFVNRYGYTGYKYVLDGGNIRDAGDGIVTELLLMTNSYMEASSSLPTSGTAWFGWSGDKHAAYADLGGHELSVKIAGTKNFGFANVTLENGSVYTGTQNGTFVTTNSVVATNNVSFRLNSNANNISGTFAVLDYAQIRSFANYNHGAYDVDVFGTFTPSVQGFFHGTTLHDGSTIDLSGLGIATLNVIAPYSAPSANTDGVKTLHFETGATIGVKFGNRKVSKDAPVISWDAETKPDDTVKFVTRDEGRRIIFIKKDDGLYARSTGLVVIVK